MMKLTFNITTSPDDTARFQSPDELVSHMEGFDGVELLCLGGDERGLIKNEQVIGLHMGFFPYWLDFFNGDEAALTAEFGSLEECERFFGGTDKRALIKSFERDLDNAKSYGAEYVVFHVSDAGIGESFTQRYRHSDEEVIDAALQLLNELFDGVQNGPALLMENLWQPGLTFTRPDMTRRLLDGVEYKNKGIMLDTGHLMHMDNSLRTQEEALRYINRMLDAHGALIKNVRGVHLNQSLTGEYCERMMAAPPPLAPTYCERYTQMFYHAFSMDRHLPFTIAGVDGLIKRIAPEYLTFEFITESRAQHREYLTAQRRALGLLD